MALKGDRATYVEDIQHTCDAAAEAGQLLIKGTQPSGHAIGQGINDMNPVATPVGTGNPASGAKVLGVLMTDVVSVDTTRYHRNFHNNEQLVNEPVNLLRDGWVWTNRINGTPVADDIAYIGQSGNFATGQVNSIPAVGKFETAKDSNGYAKVVIKIA